MILLCSLQVPLVLADLSRRSIRMIRNMAKMTAMEAMDMMIIRMEMDEKMARWWPWVCGCE